MKLQSCQNCWFNGLQYGSIGLSRGYCTRHLAVLNLPDETTCGQHIRKDLGLSRAISVSIVHSKKYGGDRIVRLSTNKTFDQDKSTSPKDIDILRDDAVADAVLDYGFLESKITAIAQFKSLDNARSDIAMSSLGRAYTLNCVRHGGKWTSGIHIYAWTRRKLTQIPRISIVDLRYTGSIEIAEQAELAQWSVMMLKIYLLDDIIAYAHQQGDALGLAHGIADYAAESVQVFNVLKLSRWIKKELLPYLDARLDRDRYNSITEDLRSKTDLVENTTEPSFKT